MRIGFGYDVHRLSTGCDLIIGGVKIPYHKGCLAHSDGDVLIHALCDALLGAAGLGDIGIHFPDSDEKYQGVNSTELLKKVVELLDNEGIKIINTDSTVVLQDPKISGYTQEMKSKLAKILKIPVTHISVKATTTENLGYEGKGEGISAYSIVLID